MIYSTVPPRALIQRKRIVMRLRTVGMAPASRRPHDGRRIFSAWVARQKNVSAGDFQEMVEGAGTLQVFIYKEIAASSRSKRPTQVCGAPRLSSNLSSTFRAIAATETGNILGRGAGPLSQDIYRDCAASNHYIAFNIHPEVVAMINGFG